MVKSKTGDTLVGTEPGTWKTRTIQRRPEDEEWTSVEKNQPWVAVPLMVKEVQDSDALCGDSGGGPAEIRDPPRASAGVRVVCGLAEVLGGPPKGPRGRVIQKLAGGGGRRSCAILGRSRVRGTGSTLTCRGPWRCTTGRGRRRRLERRSQPRCRRAMGRAGQNRRRIVLHGAAQNIFVCLRVAFARARGRRADCSGYRAHPTGDLPEQPTGVFFVQGEKG